MNAGHPVPGGGDPAPAVAPHVSLRRVSRLPGAPLWAILAVAAWLVLAGALALLDQRLGLGLGTCLQASLTHYPAAVRDFLGVSADKRLMLGISIGYPDPDARLNSYRSARASLDEFVSWHS